MPTDDTSTHATRPVPAKSITPAQQRFLNLVDALGELGFDGAHTGGIHRKRDAEALVEAGILRRLMLVVCDGDGHAIQPERERVGYARVEVKP